MTTATKAAVKRWYDLVPDPEPVEDGMLQNPIIEDIASILRVHYKPHADSVLVSGPTFILYDINDPNARIAPDCYVVFDVDAKAIVGHNSYRVWQWGKPPDFVLEVASESTALRDVREKREIYARIGAREYWRFDPSGGMHYGDALAGDRLVGGAYEPYEVRVDEDGNVWAHSDALNLDFYWRGERFWVRDSATGEWLNFLEAELAAHEVTRAAYEVTRRAHEATTQAYEESVRAHEATRAAHEATTQAHLREREGRLEAEARARRLQDELDRARRRD